MESSIDTPKFDKVNLARDYKFLNNQPWPLILSLAVVWLVSDSLRRFYTGITISLSPISTTKNVTM